MEMTMKEAGAAGVELAILDGMQAGQMARENRRLEEIICEREDEICLLKKKNAALHNEIAELGREVDALRRVNREYRKARAEGYAKALTAQAREADGRPERMRNGMLWFLGGMVTIIGLTVLVAAIAAGI